ncbi:MAG: hypothetical protein KUG78_04090 [Kangiellaceae bacterium]|nr:hypothetical protein [Kangiellaceae bacterium]
MTDPETSFAVALGKHLKDENKAKSMMTEWSGYFDSSSTNIVSLREDLSMSSD